jgi:hypothetical protein
LAASPQEWIILPAGATAATFRRSTVPRFFSDETQSFAGMIRARAKVDDWGSRSVSQLPESVDIRRPYSKQIEPVIEIFCQVGYDFLTTERNGNMYAGAPHFLHAQIDRRGVEPRGIVHNQAGDGNDERLS